MKILLNAKSRKHGVELLSHISMLIPEVRAFMFPLAGSHCISLDFNEAFKYTKEQVDVILALKSLGGTQ
jgi:hypothetical protein